MTISSQTSPSTSASLLARACDGDSASWQRLVQLYGPLVYGWARMGGLPPQDAADVTQDTFAAVAMQLSRFDAHRPGATFRGWLRTIARNKVVDLLRARGDGSPARGGTANLETLAACHAREESGESSDSQFGQDEQSERSQIVARALSIMRKHFDKSTWQAFWRTTIDGCTPDEVAQELGISRWAVYKARSRVLQRLRSELAGLEELP